MFFAILTSTFAGLFDNDSANNAKSRTFNLNPPKLIGNYKLDDRTWKIRRQSIQNLVLSFLILEFLSCIIHHP